MSKQEVSWEFQRPPMSPGMCFKKRQASWGFFKAPMSPETPMGLSGAPVVGRKRAWFKKHTRLPRTGMPSFASYYMAKCVPLRRLIQSPVDPVRRTGQEFRNLDPLL
jgi:hypothetical protein